MENLKSSLNYLKVEKNFEGGKKDIKDNKFQKT